MGRLLHHPSTPDPALVGIARYFSNYERDQLATFVEVAIGLMDFIDGDPEREEDDADSENENRHADVAWIEWTARGRYKEGQFGGERLARDHHGNTLHEDDEEDDPAEDGGDEHDTTNGEDEELCASAGINPYELNHGPGCPISDPAGLDGTDV